MLPATTREHAAPAGAGSLPGVTDRPRPDVLALWDLDLTLLDPVGFGHRMIAPALAGLLGRAPAMGVSFAGRTDRAILTELLVANGVTGPDDEMIATLLDAVADRCETHARDLIDAGGGPLPGAHAAVAALEESGVRQGIVTGNMRRTALLKLRLCGFGALPDPALGAFGDDHLDRAHLVRDAIAAARDAGLVVVPSHTVVVGDTVHDVRGALDTGARAIGVASGHVDAATLAAAGAHAVIDDLTDPAALVDAIDRVTATRV